MEVNYTSLDEWNRELAILLIPDTIVLSLYLLLGVSGNIFVIFVYRYRMRKQSEDRYFIPFLAVSDLSASFICASMAISLNMLQAKFTSNELCKTLWFFAATTTFMSILLLTIIAVHRYLKVCRPVGAQMSLRWKRFAVLLAVLLAIALGAPTAYLYGSVEFSNSNGTISGLRCSKAKNVSKQSSLIYGAIAGMVLLATVIALTIFYGRIGCTIYKHFKRMSKENIAKKHVGKPTSSKESCSIESKETSYTEMTSTKKADVIPSDGLSSENNPSNSSGYQYKDEIRGNHPSNSSGYQYKDEICGMHRRSSLEMYADKPRKKRRGKKSTNMEDINKNIMYKFTLMFMVITIVFLIVYIIKIILLISEALNPKFWENLSNKERVIAIFGYRLYIFNNVVNPFIYAFMDDKFRQESRILLGCKKH